MKDKTFWRSSLIFCVIALVVGLVSAYFYDVVAYYRYYCSIGILTTLLSFELARKQKKSKGFYESEKYKLLYEKMNPKDLKYDGLLQPYKMCLIWSYLNKICALLGTFGVLFFTGFLSIYLIFVSIVLNIYAVYHLAITRKK